MLPRGLDYLWDEGATHPRMMSIGLHSRLIGQAGRISALRDFLEYAHEKGDVWFARRRHRQLVARAPRGVSGAARLTRPAAPEGCRPVLIGTLRRLAAAYCVQSYTEAGSGPGVLSELR